MKITEYANKRAGSPIYRDQDCKAVIDELMAKGVSKGCFQDYGLLALVVEYLFLK